MLYRRYRGLILLVDYQLPSSATTTDLGLVLRLLQASLHASLQASLTQTSSRLGALAQRLALTLRGVSVSAVALFGGVCSPSLSLLAL
jgi:hypothetical protein